MKCSQAAVPWQPNVCPDAIAGLKYIPVMLIPRNEDRQRIGDWLKSYNTAYAAAVDKNYLAHCQSLFRAFFTHPINTIDPYDGSCSALTLNIAESFPISNKKV